MPAPNSISRTRFGRETLRNVHQCSELPHTETPVTLEELAISPGSRQQRYFPYKEDVGGSSPSTPTISSCHRSLSELLVSESGDLGDRRPSGCRSFLAKEEAGGSKPSTPTTESLAGSGHRSSTIQHHPDRKPLPGRKRPQPGADARHPPAMMDRMRASSTPQMGGHAARRCVADARRADSRTEEQGQAQIDRMLAR